VWSGYTAPESYQIGGSGLSVDVPSLGTAPVFESGHATDHIWGISKAWVTDSMGDPTSREHGGTRSGLDCKSVT
jgi:hypothetical protein